MAWDQEDNWVTHVHMVSCHEASVFECVSHGKGTAQTGAGVQRSYHIVLSN